MSFERKLLAWFGNGKTGASSKAMALAAAGINSDKTDHPFDPSDFNRCLLLVEAVPEIRDHFDRIAALSTTWRRFIENWDELERVFIDEVGRDWSLGRRAPVTYERIQAVRKLPDKD